MKKLLTKAIALTAAMTVLAAFATHVVPTTGPADKLQVFAHAYVGLWLFFGACVLIIETYNRR